MLTPSTGRLSYPPTLDGHNSFQLNEQHLDDIQYKVGQIQHKNPSQITRKESLVIHFIYEESVSEYKGKSKRRD